MAAEDYLPDDAQRLPRYDEHPISLRKQVQQLEAALKRIKVAAHVVSQTLTDEAKPRFTKATYKAVGRLLVACGE